MSDNEQLGVWLGIKRCGCLAAVCSDSETEHLQATKRDFLDRGWSVLYATWADWLATWRPKLLEECSH